MKNKEAVKETLQFRSLRFAQLEPRDHRPLLCRQRADNLPRAGRELHVIQIGRETEFVQKL